MYSIDKKTNSISKIEKKSFAELNFEERANLQEWIVKSPEALGEELLIIQKEFDGFNDTKERLDLLALDKQGNLVIIENKLDDSGKDVTWQVIKYASYCSSLSKKDIIKIYQKYLGIGVYAEERLSEFFDNKPIEEIAINNGLNSQRLIMVAANFRKEVTSTVLWLLNFSIRLQCFKVTPFQMGEQLFLTFEQILPTKDAEDYSISIATKSQEEAQDQEKVKNYAAIRQCFWSEFLQLCNQKTNLFQNSSPSKENWMGKGIGMSGVNINLVISKVLARAEVYFNRGSKEENKALFDTVELMKESIESEFGEKLTWERMDDKVTCRIKTELSNIDCFETDKERAFEFMIDAVVRMEKAFKKPISKLNQMNKTK